MLRASLVKRFGAFTLDVSFDVAPGNTLVLVGESGAGKTTVLRLLAGLATPEGGRLELDGVCYADGTRQVVPAWERDTGWVPQDSSLFPHMSARENVLFGLRASGVPVQERDARAQQAIDRFGVGPFAGRRPHQLSGGQQQRVALARALVLDPKLLLLDEPLSSLDLKSRDAMREELRSLLAQRTGVTVFVTHSAEEAKLLGNQVLTIDAGRVVAEDLGSEARSDH